MKTTKAERDSAEFIRALNKVAATDKVTASVPITMQAQDWVVVGTIARQEGISLGEAFAEAVQTDEVTEKYGAILQEQ